MLYVYVEKNQSLPMDAERLIIIDVRCGAPV